LADRTRCRTHPARRAGPADRARGAVRAELLVSLYGEVQKESSGSAGTRVRHPGRIPRDSDDLH
jgi:hypothetical protein